MEGFRQRDEYEHLKGRLPPPDAALTPSMPFTRPMRDLSPAELDVLQAVLNGTNATILLDTSPLTDLEIVTSLVTLIEKGFVRKT